MSNYSEVKKPSLTPSKLLFGGGDGNYNASGKKKFHRQHIPMPSCRRFATHWEAKNATVKEKLERAIKEMESPKKPPTISIPRGLRRSISMSELTVPRKQYPIKIRCRLDDDQQQQGVIINGHRQMQSADEDIAGRRVYELLLLNAWRQRRKEAKNLNEILQKFQSEIEQLKLQKDVLQKLRESESRRRSEAANEGALLRERIEKQEEEIENLYEERKSFLQNIEELQEGMDSLKIQGENSRNDWLAMKCEMKALEQQLMKERGKIRKMANDKRDLQEKISQYEFSLCRKNEELAQIKNGLRDAEVNIQNVIDTNIKKEEEKKLLELQLQNEKKANLCLVRQLNENECTIQNLEDKIFELREKLCESKELNTKLKESNEGMAKEIQEAKIIVAEMKSRTWYKTAGELARGSLTALQYAALLMLPALPQHFEKK